MYVVGCCTKGVVRLTYEWCHVIIPLLCCNELYSWWTVTPRVSLCPLLLSAHWAWPRASAIQEEFGELVYMACTLEATPRGSHKKWDRAVDPKGIQKMTQKNRRGTLTLENFRMLNFDEFISNSSYTTKVYMKNGWFGSKLSSWEISNLVVFSCEICCVATIFYVKYPYFTSESQYFEKLKFQRR